MMPNSPLILKYNRFHKGDYDSIPCFSDFGQIVIKTMVFFLLIEPYPNHRYFVHC